MSETVLPEEPFQVDGDPPREDEIDPCSLVTKAEVEEILDQPVTDFYRHSRTVCEYFSDVGGSFGSVTIRLSTAVSQAVLDDEVRVAEEVAASPAEAVPGLGNAAYSVGPILYVYEKDTLLVIAVIVSDAVELAGAKDVAAKVLPRLP